MSLRLTKQLKILFLDQSGNVGGAELSLLDVVTPYREHCTVCLFEDGLFRHFLEERQIRVHVLERATFSVGKKFSLLQSLGSLRQVIPLIQQVMRLSREHDVIYANTAKSFVVGAIASALSRRPLIYHLRDILSTEHFSRANQWVMVTLANCFAKLVIANSKATQAAFVAAGGEEKLTTVVYNGFQPKIYQSSAVQTLPIREELGLTQQFVVGHFSRLSPWKGQHVLLEALRHCPEDVTALFVGDALFGEQEYVQQLHQQVIELGLENRVRFIGFRSDIPQLMAACDLIAHTSTAPEPFGRVIVEAMLCSRPVVAAQAGGAMELVRHGKTGWLCLPNDPQSLADIIMDCRNRPQQAQTIAQQAQREASQRFHLNITNYRISQLLDRIPQRSSVIRRLADRAMNHRNHPSQTKMITRLEQEETHQRLHLDMIRR